VSDPPSPYRDDRAALLDEIERLKRGRRRAWKPRVALALLAAHLVLRGSLTEWLNGQSDGRFWLAVVVVYGPLVGAGIVLAIWALRRGDRNS
jgi:hypothetical protein